MIRPVHPPLRPNLSLIATILRIREWLPLTGLALLGYVFTGPLSAPAQPVLVLAAGALYLAQGYGFNCIADAETDPPERNPLAQAPGSARSAWLICSAIAALGLAVCLAVGVGTALAFLAGIIINTTYSFPPLRLKRFVLSNIVLNSAGFTALVLIGALARPADILHLLLLAGTIFFIFIPYQLVHIFTHKQHDPMGGLSGNLFLPSFMAGHVLLLGWAAFFTWRLNWWHFFGAVCLHALAHLVVISRADDMRSVPTFTCLRRNLRVIGIGWGIILSAVFYLQWL